MPHLMPEQSCTTKLKALADDTRWRIIDLLVRENRANVTQLTERLRVSQPSISKHLRILRAAGIIASEKERTMVWCFISPEWKQNKQDDSTILDVGCCLVRFPAKTGEASKS